MTFCFETIAASTFVASFPISRAKRFAFLVTETIKSAVSYRIIINFLTGMPCRVKLLSGCSFTFGHFVNNNILLSLHLSRLGFGRTKDLQLWIVLSSVSGFSRNSTWRSLADTEKIILFRKSRSFVVPKLQGFALLLSSVKK